jgi:hypothetical protein
LPAGRRGGKGQLDDAEAGGGLTYINVAGGPIPEN